jgi:exopolysaccharide biosynthesis polyprenyl glycosylphosphotransferase
LLCSALLLIVSAPLMVLAAIAVKLESRGPLFYRQERVGLHGRPFMVTKFRSMRQDAEKDGKPRWATKDDDRVTRVGKFIRRTRIDELPQLFNVFTGEMSLVGPRPLLMEYLSLYTPEQARRHEVRPGITGWAQVNGRNAISWADKFELDVVYVQKQNLWLDIKILWMTVRKVLVRDGISAEGEATMSKFTGN